MKKFLLSFAAALMVAASVSAQSPLASRQKMALPNGIKLEKATLCDIQKPMAQAARKAAANVVGEYILNSANWDGDFTSSQLFTIEEATGSIDLPEDEEGQVEKFEYNVVLKNFPSSKAVVYGYYDAEANAIEIPSQKMGNSVTDFGLNKDYGDVIFSGVLKKNGQVANFGFDMLLMFDEEGQPYFYDFKDELAQVEAFGEGCEISGYYDYLPAITSGANAFNYGFDCEVFIPNATFQYYTTSKTWGATGNGWAEGKPLRVNIQDFDEELIVSNFFGTAVSISVDKAAGTCLLGFGQDYDEYDYEDYDDSFAWGRLQFHGVCENADGYLDIDYEAEGLQGYLFDGGMRFYQIEKNEEDGKYYIVQELAKYFCVATARPEGDDPYFGGYFCNAFITYDEEKDPEGISDAVVAAKGNKQAYNLMGQRVNNDAKGIVVLNGKKMLRK